MSTRVRTETRRLAGVPRQGSVNQTKSWLYSSAGYGGGRREAVGGDVTPRGENVPVLSQGESFGQLALLHELPTTCTITARDTQVCQAHVQPEGVFQRQCGLS